MSSRTDRLRRLAAPVVLLLLCGTAPLQADELVLRNGKKHYGQPRAQGAEIHLNEYGCGAAEMTLGVRRFRKIDVREIRPRPLADHLHGRLAELAAGDVDRRVDLMRQAQSGRLKDLAERIALEILRVAPAHAEALDVVGGKEKWEARRRGDPALDPTLATELRRLLRIESGADRREDAARLERLFGYAPGPDVIERMVRSARQDRGLREDVALRMDAKDFEEGRYTLYVPPTYDATVARPLLLALHGGGIMHDKGERTRGTAKDALAHYLDGAVALGWFVLAPTALEAPWPTSRNHAWIDAVLAEVTTLWNIDLERIHLAGQGGGGDGVWYHASRRADRYASISVAAAGKPVGATSAAGKAALWLYHGDADEVVPIDPVRKAAASLLRIKADFVYCELPREGHGFAPAAKRDNFRFIAPKRRRRAKSAWPRSSFTVPSSRAAIEAFGDPAAGWGVGFDASQPAEALVGILAQGRTDAEFAARRLAEAHASRRDALSAAVRAIVKDREAPGAARVWAAWLCGAWRDPAAINELGDTLRTSKDTLLLRYAADAVAQIGSPDNAQDLHWALGDVSARYRALPGAKVVYQDFDRACRLGAAIASAIGVVGKEDETFFAELEEHLVRHLLMDQRPILFNAANGEDPSLPRSFLAENLAHAYRCLGAEKTLYDMLRQAVKGDEAALRAVLRGQRRPPR